MTLEESRVSEQSPRASGTQDGVSLGAVGAGQRVVPAAVHVALCGSGVIWSPSAVTPAVAAGPAPQPLLEVTAFLLLQSVFTALLLFPLN